MRVGARRRRPRAGRLDPLPGVASLRGRSDRLPRGSVRRARL